MSYATPKYKRTVRCRYCHKPGHNKSSCPQYAARVEDMREKYGSDYWMVAQYDEKKAKRSAAGKDRKCSYCGEGGHNRGTCGILKTHMEETKEANIVYRQRAFQRLVHHGLFTGALVTNGSVTVNRGDEVNKFTTPLVVTRVCWENINVWNREYRYFSDSIIERPPFELKPLSAVFRPYPVYSNFPYDYELNYVKMSRSTFNRYTESTDANGSWYAQYRDQYFIRVVSKVLAEAPPVGWLSCEDKDFNKSLKEFYKYRTKENGTVGISAFVGLNYEAVV